MATDYPGIWNSILGQPGTQNVDVIASLNEDGINNYLQAHFTIDNRVYHRVIKKVFNTQTDSREFTVSLDIGAPLQIQFPPFRDQAIAREYTNKQSWYKLESDHDGPEISALMDDTNKIQVYCNSINITLTWPKLHPAAGDTSPWSITLKTLKVFAEAFAILKNDQDGYFVSLIPTIVKVDVANPLQLTKDMFKIDRALTAAEQQLLDDCQQKFTDLFVIAADIIATEQAPKLVRNLRIPVPTIKDRPILPSLLNISQNCLTVGAGIDKPKAQKALQAAFDKHAARLQANMEADIEKAGGLLKLVSNNETVPSRFEDLKLKSPEEVIRSFTGTQEFLRTFADRVAVSAPAANIRSASVVDNAYAIGINQYFFQTIVSSIIPAPKNDCSGWLDLKVVRGRACYWVKFDDPTVVVSPNASLTGGVNIDIGGSIEACIRKFWDCSWSWSCGSLALSLKGRPTITLKLLTNNGVNFTAQMGGSLYFDVNLPFPFNKIINALTSIIGQVIIGIINIFLGLLQFVVIYPVITVPQQITKIKLRDFNSFYYPRPVLPGSGDPKNHFIAYKGGLISEK
jgi:hypothetical protein